MYFVPDLVTGQRFALGAWLVTPGQTSFVESAHQPGPACLGGLAHERLAKRILERVESIQDLSDRGVTTGLGQYAQLSPAFEIPADVASAERWLRERVLPAHPREAQARTVRRRDSEGLRFLRSRKVDHYVKPRFDAFSYWRPEGEIPWIRQARATHWVDGGKSLLLLEPVLVRDDRTDLDGISSRVMALDIAIKELGARDTHRVATYVLPGGAASKRNAVLQELRQWHCDVWDTSRPTEADALVDSVRDIAALHPAFALG